MHDRRDIFVVADRQDQRAARAGQLIQRFDKCAGGCRIVGGVEHDRRVGRSDFDAAGKGGSLQSGANCIVGYAPALVPQFGDGC